jgi:hypothetical protein
MRSKFRVPLTGSRDKKRFPIPLFRQPPTACRAASRGRPRRLRTFGVGARRLPCLTQRLHRRRAEARRLHLVGRAATAMAITGPGTFDAPSAMPSRKSSLALPTLSLGRPMERSGIKNPAGAGRGGCSAGLPTRDSAGGSNSPRQMGRDRVRTPASSEFKRSHHPRGFRRKIAVRQWVLI